MGWIVRIAVFTGRAQCVVGIIVAVALLGCGDDGLPSGSIAKVGDVGISTRYFHRQTAKADQVRARVGDAPELSHRRILSGLIRTEWLMQEAKAQGVPTPRIRDRSHRQDETAHLLAERVSTGKGTASSAEARRYYDTHRRELYEKEHRSIQLLQASSHAKAQRAAAALANGATWLDAIKRYGTRHTLTYDNHGLLTVERVNLPPGLASVVFKAPQGPNIGPLKVQGSWVIVRVIRITRGFLPTFKQAEASIRDAIIGRKRVRIFERYEAGLKARYRPMTVCSDELHVPECSNR